jgi:hypothetical protein
MMAVVLAIVISSSAAPTGLCRILFYSQRLRAGLTSSAPAGLANWRDGRTRQPTFRKSHCCQRSQKHWRVASADETPLPRCGRPSRQRITSRGLLQSSGNCVRVMQRAEEQRVGRRIQTSAARRLDIQYRDGQTTRRRVESNFPSGAPGYRNFQCQ